MKDGWHNVGRNQVYVENGRVKRGVNFDGTLPVYPYRWNNSLRCWVYDDSMTLAALRAGIKRGTVDLK